MASDNCPMCGKFAKVRLTRESDDGIWCEAMLECKSCGYRCPLSLIYECYDEGYRFGWYSNLLRKLADEAIKNREMCSICENFFAPGITIQKHGKGWAHPECVIGVEIDHGD